MGSARRLSSWRVEEAVRVIAPVCLVSPQFVCEPLGDELGVRLAIKVETLTRSVLRPGDGLLVLRPRMGLLVCASAGT